jgi:uncharacterized protein (TIGR00255 family)
MPHSMTAYHREESRGQWGNLSWELRSVNHRYLDLGIRLPDEFRPIESLVRERIAEQVSRGKVEVSLRHAGAARSAHQVNWTAVDQWLDVLRAVRARAGEAAAPLDAVAVLGLPGVITVPVPDVTPLMAEALGLLDRTVAGFVALRAREGERLAAGLRQRCASLTAMIADCARHAPRMRQRLSERLARRLAECAETADPMRLEQELVLAAMRMDVDEEIERMRSHLLEIETALAADTAVGRRLDFLIQELHREANTLGSKSAGIETSALAVDMKVLIDQLREQVQNIE